MDPKRGERARATMLQQLSKVPDEMGRNPLSTESIDRSHNDYPTQYKKHEYSGSSLVENRSTYLDRDTGEDTPMVTLLTDYTVPQKNVTCDTYSLHITRNVMKQQGKIDHQTDNHYVLKYNPLYQDCKVLNETLAQYNVKWYDEVPEGQTLHNHYSNVNPYKDIQARAGIQGNLYETLGDIKGKNSKFTMGNTVGMKNMLLLMVHIILLLLFFNHCFHFSNSRISSGQNSSLNTKKIYSCQQL